MMEFYNETSYIARKEHECEMCNDKIRIGERYIRGVGKYEGSLFTRKLHVECDKVFSEFVEDTGADEYSYDEIMDWWRENKCPNCKNYYPKCSDVMDESCIANSPKLCPDMTAAGRCSAMEHCDEMTRVCWCENYEPIKEK